MPAAAADLGLEIEVRRFAEGTRTARRRGRFAIGGTAPFGHPASLPTLVDPDLLDHDEVWAAAGTPDSVFALSPEALVRATGGRVCDVRAGGD